MKALVALGSGCLLCLCASAAGVASYTADPAQSHLQFTGIQAGAPFTGEFGKFTAAVDFAPDALATSRIDVTIEVGSENSKDKDRDTTILSADLFNAAKFPTAHYVTKSIAKSANGYEAVGSLTLRGVTKDVPISFKLNPGAGGAKLEGTANLKRLDFGVGQGDWKATDQVADAVKVAFSLTLKPKN
jgi:polyisoprenoid-binding protein YceI